MNALLRTVGMTNLESTKGKSVRVPLKLSLFLWRVLSWMIQRSWGERMQEYLVTYIPGYLKRNAIAVEKEKIEKKVKRSTIEKTNFAQTQLTSVSQNKSVIELILGEHRLGLPHANHNDLPFQQILQWSIQGYYREPKAVQQITNAYLLKAVDLISVAKCLVASNQNFTQTPIPVWKTGLTPKLNCGQEWVQKLWEETSVEQKFYLFLRMIADEGDKVKKNTHDKITGCLWMFDAVDLN